MVVRPERGATAWRDRLEVVGGGPATPAIHVPAVPLEPGIGIAGRRRVRGADTIQALGKRDGIGQVDLAGGVGRAGEVQVRVGQARYRHLIGLERDPLGERVGARLERDLGPGEGDPPVTDADRLDPAEATLAGQRRDPPGDEHVERHGQASGSASRATSPARSSPAPSPSASATRALTAHRWPTGRAPARIHSAPPPGKA
jgi:hypothetical protein